MDAIDWLVERSNEQLVRAKKLSTQVDSSYIPTDEEVYEFYHSREWKNKRLEVLHRDYYKDQVELRESHRLKPGNTVHHIYALRDYWDLRLESDNLEVVSPDNHNTEHPEKGMHKAKRAEFKQKQAAKLDSARAGIVVKSKKNEELL